MLTKTRRTSVPQIFIDQTHVGGFEELIALDRAGGLKPLLENSP
jgi:glutaredoxin 3